MNESRNISLQWRILAPLVALGGGLLGVLGAIFQEATRGFLLMVFVAGPMIEEVMKPTGVYLLLALKPDVLVKGSDYTLDKVVGRKEVESYGGSVRLVPITPNASTTKIIRDIVRNHGS